ncbi:MAG TPA: hypothetical protein VGH82_08215 [Gaiellaceae bacterium]|jgi:uncharacterized membrane protein YgcG
MKLKGFLLVATAAAALTAFWPAAGSAATFRGVVVAHQRGSLLVAMPGGLVRAVSGHAALGSRVVATARGVSIVGRASTAVIHGIVVRRIGTTLILSSDRHLLALHHARVLAGVATTPTAPAPGAVVSTTVGIANGELNEQDEDEIGEVNANSIQVQAVVAAVGTGTVTLTVQGQMLVVPLPAGLTFPASLVGQTVTISLSLAVNDDDQGDDNDGGGHDGGGHDGGGGDGGGHDGGGGGDG